MPSRLAPAKVNLTLHVTGRQPDGYHLLDSLVVFAAVGDIVTFVPGAHAGLRITGPLATGVPQGPENLIARAARLIEAPAAAFILDKRLPASAGMGGGSSDAAAALHLLAECRGLPLPTRAALMGLGADLPVCMAAPAPCRMRGRGEWVEPLAPLPQLGLLIVNPGVPLSTAAVFSALKIRDNSPMPDVLPDWSDADDFCAWLADMRNDLEPPARRLLPVIDELLKAIANQPGCRLARMTGSGATCFGIFSDRNALRRAAETMHAPGRFVAATETLNGDVQLTRATT
ncbi:4-(cytidine 5'-diphospho)-2-C-methyl-D-erythritol kinase [Pararhodobacter sp. SW119]|uniref:4-(cytidine 5'-diphospho)-2-C-methyl-D-erythritol kinase n=1 Tax=Pararhodobacter sp. SW119 TaxID=2780075 RepID=UPI001ADF0848|nr:4-(cytidine 5'-diphospho)-2-C-methyl-D-erythritol kinase [Pararhodobacter sp. SW119]